MDKDIELEFKYGVPRFLQETCELRMKGYLQ